MDARRGALPVTVVLLVASPVYWAFPEDLAPWRGGAIVAGWLGCGLLLASLLLMIREPRLAEWMGGLERMYRWHHRLGAGAYFAFLVHPLALALDAIDESPGAAWAVLAPWRQGWPAWLGWASLLTMMLGMAAALARALPYGTWRGLHLLLAASAALGVGHLLLLGLDYLLLWAPLLAIAFMVWRFLRADAGLGAVPHVVTSVAHPALDTVEVRLRPLGHPLAARPGQFVLAAFGRGPRFRGCGEFHPFTLSDIRADGTLTLDIRALGDCTRHLQQLERDVAVRVQGPFGSFLAGDAADMEKPALWIAGGIGITPFLAALRGPPPRQPIRLLYLHRGADDAAHADELLALARAESRLRLDLIATGEHLPDLGAALPPATELAGVVCHLCGPPGLLQAAVAVLQARGVPARYIHFERFDFR